MTQISEEQPKDLPTEQEVIQARLSHWLSEKGRLDKELAEARFNIKRYERLLRDYNEFKQSIK